VALARKDQVGEVVELAPQPMSLGERPVELAVDRHHREPDLRQIQPLQQRFAPLGHLGHPRRCSSSLSPALRRARSAALPAVKIIE
jgi:hypothetical protein